MLTWVEWKLGQIHLAVVDFCLVCLYKRLPDAKFNQHGMILSVYWHWYLFLCLLYMVFYCQYFSFYLLNPTMLFFLITLEYKLLLLFSHSVVSDCNSMDYSTPGFPVLHYHLEFAQIHVHWVCEKNYLMISSSAALFSFCLQFFPE